MKDEHIYKSHNKTLLLYHLVFPAKYRKKVFDDKIDQKMTYSPTLGSGSMSFCFFIVLKNEQELDNADDVLSFTFILHQKLKPIIIDFSEDKLSFSFNQKQLIKDIQARGGVE